MRPTRWTRLPRVTKKGMGGWNVRIYWEPRRRHRLPQGTLSISYVNPRTGDGADVSGWNPLKSIRKVLKIRRRAEERRAEYRRCGCEPNDHLCKAHGHRRCPTCGSRHPSWTEPTGEQMTGVKLGLKPYCPDRFHRSA